MSECGIYVITHIETGRRYVGQSIDIASRIRFHAHAYGKLGAVGKEIKRCGWDAFNHEVVAICSPDVLDEFENMWVKKLGCLEPAGFNQQMPGTNETAPQRQARSRQARKEAGGKAIHVMLTPKAAEKLAKWRLRGMRIAEVVNSLLEASKP